MRGFTVNSNVHGKRIILVDNEDYPKLEKHTWGIKTSCGNNRQPVAYTTIDGYHYLMHRMIAEKYNSGDFKVRHNSKNTLDNRKVNLLIG